MNDIDINSRYFSDKPHSYGGKYRLYELYNKDVAVNFSFHES